MPLIPSIHLLTPFTVVLTLTHPPPTVTNENDKTLLGYKVSIHTSIQIILH